MAVFDMVVSDLRQFAADAQSSPPPDPTMEPDTLAAAIKTWGTEIGFQQVGITGIDLAEDEHHLLDWLDRGMHGEMAYMERHGSKRSRPERLRPGTLRVISARMDYLPAKAKPAQSVLDDKETAYVSRYALGRDYHKVMRSRLKKLARRVEAAIGPFGYRVFTDTAPVLEKALARNAGLGWIGKHSNLLHTEAGSWFFIGEIYTDLPLPVGRKVCQGDLRRLPSVYRRHARHAPFVAPYQVDPGAVSPT